MREIQCMKKTKPDQSDIWLSVCVKAIGVLDNMGSNSNPSDGNSNA